MPRRGSRRRLAPNIFEDGSGCAVKVTIAGRTRERRFPTGTPLDVLEDARLELLGQQQAARRPGHGTLAEDAAAYLRTIADGKKRTGQAILVAHWVRQYGAMARQALTPLAIRQQLAAWLSANVAPSTCNKRLSALRAVWREVGDPDEPNYPAQVRKLPEPAPEPRALAYDVIARILAAMPDRGRAEKGQPRATVSLTKLRLTLMAYTGLPPAQIARIDPRTDIDWQGPTLRVRPRRKGKGRPEQWVQLIPQAAAALRGLVAAGALPGSYSNDSVTESWRRACRVVIAQQRAAGEPMLPHRLLQDGRVRPLVRVYDLRHSFGTLALSLSRDLAGVQHLMLHSDPRQTSRYTLGAMPEAARRVAAAVAAGLRAPASEAKDPGTPPQAVPDESVPD